MCYIGYKIKQQYIITRDSRPLPLTNSLKPVFRDFLSMHLFTFVVIEHMCMQGKSLTGNPTGFTHDFWMGISTIFDILYTYLILVGKFVVVQANKISCGSIIVVFDYPNKM
jgi:hypothetical protein